uniref:Uncharacterized protein n=1 Tax=Schistocephalus solidus TaxID=70667 RepID=A0A0X3P4T7_SCHSO
MTAVGAQLSVGSYQIILRNTSLALWKTASRRTNCKCAYRLDRNVSLVEYLISTYSMIQVHLTNMFPRVQRRRQFRNIQVTKGEIIKFRESAQLLFKRQSSEKLGPSSWHRPSVVDLNKHLSTNEN